MSVKYETLSTWILDDGYVFVVIRTYDESLVSILVHRDLVNEKDKTVELEEKNVGMETSTFSTPDLPTAKYTTADGKDVFLSPTNCDNGADLVVASSIAIQRDKIL